MAQNIDRRRMDTIYCKKKDSDVAIGVGGGNAVALFMNTAVTFPWMWAGVGLLVCGGIGSIFGLYPAWKAARLDPIEALRYE